MFVIFSVRDAFDCAHHNATVILTAIDDYGLIISDHLKNLKKAYLKNENINIRLNAKSIGCAFIWTFRYICSVMCSVVDHLASWSIYKVNWEGNGIKTEAEGTFKIFY